MEFKAYASTTVSITGLEVRHGSLGKHHAFRFKGYDCKVALPGSEKIGVNDLVRRSSWRADAPDDLDQTWFSVHQVLVLFDLLEPVQHDGEESDFNSPAVASSPWGVQVRRDFPLLLAAIFDHWLRVVRSATLSSTIRTTKDDTIRFEGGFRVRRSSDNKLFTGYGGMAHLQSKLQVDPDGWDDMQAMFDRDYDPPMWLNYLLDGMHRLRESDLTGAVVSTVIACETVVRAIFWSHVPAIQNEPVSQIIDSFSIQSLFSRLDTLTGVSKVNWKKAGKADVHKLFDLRNSIVHRGETASLDAQLVSRLLISAKSFVTLADAVYRGFQNPVVGTERAEVLSVADEASGQRERSAEATGPLSVVLRDA